MTQNKTDAQRALDEIEFDDEASVPDYSAMTREELIECCEAHDAHHNEHHAREAELEAALSQSVDAEEIKNIAVNAFLKRRGLVRCQGESLIVTIIEEAMDCLNEQGYLRTPAPQWQDISTAPKDGSKILLCSMSVSDDAKANGRVNGMQAVDFWHTKVDHDFTGWGKFNPYNFPATHWMPLPQPPMKPKGE